MAQTLPPTEVICVEDCSTDSTLFILQTYQKRYPNTIKIVQNKQNEGLGAARNAGVAASSGEYLSFIDSDDFIHPNFLGELYKNIQAYDAEIAYCRVKHQESLNGPFINYRHQMQVGQTGLLPLVSTRGFSYSEHIPSACSCLYSRSFYLEKIHPAPIVRFAEDYLPFDKRWVLTKKVCFVAEAIYYYRMNKQSITNSTARAVQINLLTFIYHECYEFLKKELKHDAKETFCYYVGTNICGLEKTALTQFIANSPELSAADFKPWLSSYYHEYLFKKLHPKTGYLQHDGIKRLLKLVLYNINKSFSVS